jgi:hypothetical protein
VFSKDHVIRTNTIAKPDSNTTYGAETCNPRKLPTNSDGLPLHQSSKGREYCDMPIAEVTVPARSSGSACKEILSISPSEIVTIAK